MKKKKNTIKKIIRNTFLFIYAIGYIVANTFNWLDKNVPRLFMKAPRLFRQIVIYSMIILSVACFMDRGNSYALEIPNTRVIKVINNRYVDPNNEIVEEKKCTMSDIECSIYNEAIRQGLTENQAYMVLAISKHETGRWTSSAFKDLNNIGGIMCSTGLKKYKTLSDGIEDTVGILKKYYFDKGLDTLEKIQPKYCPIGAKNDPNGLNNYWLKNTTIFYNEYLKESK